jgi:hypothetical protein
MELRFVAENVQKMEYFMVPDQLQLALPLPDQRGSDERRFGLFLQTIKRTSQYNLLGVLVINA